MSVLVVEPSMGAPVRQICAKGRAAGPAWKFCAYEYAGSSRKVLFYFHGIGGSERDWSNHELERRIVERWQQRGLRPPVVVSISLGPLWLLTEKGRAAKSGYFEFVRDFTLPEIQRRVLNFPIEESWLMGVSMGGFNAAQFYFKEPGFFTRAALICPAMAMVSPFHSPYTVENYIRRTGAIPALVWGALYLMKEYLPDPAAWARHSPIELARTYFSGASKPLFVSNGTGDEFGFHEGNIDFARWARERGVDVRSTFYAGRSHCHVEAAPIADFFQP